ncbi:MAG: 16S rRNA processing protein RimM [Rikenellaceae bacterium]
MESVARINRLFGTDGEVMITIYPTLPDDFKSTGKPLFAKIDGLNVPLYLEKFERRGRAGAVVSFADIDTERRVMELLNTELYLPDIGDDMSELSADDEFTLEDLVGYTVEAATASDASEIYEGEITSFYDGNNPLFGVTFGESEVLIPAAEEFIGGINFEEGHIVFILPEGLLDL